MIEVNREAAHGLIGQLSQRFGLAVQILNDLPHLFAVVDAGLRFKEQLLEQQECPYFRNVVRNLIRRNRLHRLNR